MLPEIFIMRFNRYIYFLIIYIILPNILSIFQNSKNQILNNCIIKEKKRVITFSESPRI